MPAELVRREYAKEGGDFDVWCEAFNASRQAMGKRLHTAM